MILKLFDFPELPTTVILYQCQENQPIFGAAVEMLSILPEKSVFVAYEHGKSSFSIRNIDVAQSQINLRTSVIYHLNHERPWHVLGHGDDNSLDRPFASIDELIQSYARFPLVLRNYYYKPLLQHSTYLPVGPTLVGYVIGNSSSPLFQQSARAASQRGIFCQFRGRLKYQYLLYWKEGNKLGYDQENEVNVSNPSALTAKVAPSAAARR